MHKKLKHNGFSVIELIVIIFVLAVLGAAGFIAWNKFQEKRNANTEVVWAFNEQNNQWFAKTGKAPSCKEPFVFDQSPVDITKIDGVLLPGAYRGFSYKPHGGFGVTAQKGAVEIKMPMDATLVGLTRYYEGDPADLQYLLTFESDCGIAFRFDHIYILTPEFQKLAEQTPEPKINDTRTSPDDNPPRTKFKSGQTIATQVGLPKMNIYGFDFGVYDYRKQNEISKNSDWAKLHSQYKSLDWYGVCWFDMLPGNAPEITKQLSLDQTDTRRTVKKVSDYCNNAPYQTLDINGGKPTDG